MNNKANEQLLCKPGVIHEGSSVCIHRKSLIEHQPDDKNLKNGFNETKKAGKLASDETFVAVKTLASKYPQKTQPTFDPEDSLVNFSSSNEYEAFIARLNNEYNILSRHFTIFESNNTDKHESNLLNTPHNHQQNTPFKRRRSNNIRIPLGRTIDESGKLQSINLQYVPGISLYRWINSDPYVIAGEPTRYELLDRLCVAVGVAGALADVNDAGVVHNDVSPSSFIVDTSPGVHSRRCEGVSGGGDDDDDEEEEEERSGKSDNSRNYEEREGLHPWSVNIISFGFAEYGNSIEADDVGERVNDDLPALGSVLEYLFVGDVEANEKRDDEKKGGVNDNFDNEEKSQCSPFPDSVNGEYDAMAAKRAKIFVNLPQSIKRMLSNLLTPTDFQGKHEEPDYPYKTSREVYEDLVQMMDDPDAFFFDQSPNCKNDKLRFPRRKLYGRCEESSILKEGCYRISNQKSHFTSTKETQSNSIEPPDTTTKNTKNAEITFICGSSGTGKSELVRSICRNTIQNLNGSFAYGKFDQLHSGQPYSALILAFTELCHDILSRDQTYIDSISRRIRSAVGKLGKVVTDVIPILSRIIGRQPELPSSLEGAELQNRFNYVMKMFAGVISTPEHPVVLVLDDLQWADSASMNLINLLVKDVQNASLMFVGCYRDNEVDHTHSLSVLLNDLRNSNIVMNEISLGVLNVKSVNRLVSDSLRMSQRLTRDLTDIVYNKTHGNVFFVIEFLKSLYNEKVIKYSSDQHRWVWNMDELTACNISDNVVEMMSHKMLQLSQETQDVIKIAAGIGSYFDSQIVRLVLKERVITRDSCNAQLEFLTKEGLITKLRGNSSNRATRYKFSHDRIQQAAYSLLPEDDRHSLHLHIGRLMLRRCEGSSAYLGTNPSDTTGITTTTSSSKEVDSDILFFITADQLNRGSSLIKSKTERLSLARLNLRAGVMAMQSSAFGPAAGYFNAGIKMLGRNRWKSQYNLSLMLYSNLAETEYCNGLFDKVKSTVDEVFLHSSSINDKFAAYSSLMMAMGANGDTSEAVEVGLEVLSQLGETFPKKINTPVIIFDLVKTKFALYGKNDKTLLSLPPMTDQYKKMAMFVLSKLYSFSAQGPTHYIPVLINRMVRLTIRYGTCEASALGFTLFGSVLCGVLGDVSGGLRYGQLGLQLSNRFDSNKWVVRSLCVMVFTIWGWAIPHHQILGPCMKVYSVGMEVGDNEYAMYGVWNFSINSILGGKPLGPLVEDMRSYAQLMLELGQTNVHMIFLPLLQCALNLTGSSENPILLNGEMMEQDQFHTDCEKNPMAQCDAHILCLMLSYLFHDYDLAMDMFLKSKDASKIFPGCCLVWVRTYYGALSSFAMASKAIDKNNNNKKKKKWLSKARALKNMIRKLTVCCPETFLPKYKLLVAENCAVVGKIGSAMKAYDDAIAMAHKCGLVNDEALASERAGIFLRTRGDHIAATSYFEHANGLYLKWGAFSKTEDS